MQPTPNKLAPQRAKTIVRIEINCWKDVQKANHFTYNMLLLTELVVT